MSKKLIRTTSFLIGSILLALSFLFALPKMAAYADDTEVYPSSFISAVSFTSLTDFAVGSDGYLFIDNGLLYRYVRGANAAASSYTATSIEAKACDYSDGNYYYIDSTDITRSFSDNQETSYQIRGFEPFYLNGYSYSYSSNTYRAWDGADTITDFAGVTTLKSYSEAIYAIQNGAMVSISGATISQFGTLEYLNYGLTTTIPTGTLAASLKATPIEFATVAVGAYMTELDLSDLSGTYLKVGQTISSSGGTGLVLAREGNATVFLLSGSVYMALSTNLTTTSLTYETSPTFSSAKVNLLGGAVYSTAYAAKATEVEILPTDTEVRVLGVCSSSVFGGTFYRISYSSGEAQKTGYIPTAFLSEAEIVEDGNTQVTDPNYQVDSLVQRVILILAIIMLILVAAFYLVHIATRPKIKSKKVNLEDNLNEDNEM